MARRKKYRLGLWAPQVECWNETEIKLPSAPAPFLAMRISKGGTIRVGLDWCY
jgi:hypothetical protein